LWRRGRPGLRRGEGGKGAGFAFSIFAERTGGGGHAMESRATSVSTRTPIQTTLREARAAAHAMGSLQKDKLEVRTVQG